MWCGDLLSPTTLSKLSGPGLLSHQWESLFSLQTGSLCYGICGELHNVLHHQPFFAVLYSLHSKWPKVITIATVNLCCCNWFSWSTFTCWGLPSAINTDNGPKVLSWDFIGHFTAKRITHIVSPPRPTVTITDFPFARWLTTLSCLQTDAGQRAGTSSVKNNIGPNELNGASEHNEKFTI